MKLNGIASTEKLVEIANSLGNKVRAIANIVIDNPKFAIWSGSSKSFQHHYGYGGLATHTLEVVELSLSNNAFFDKIGEGVDPAHVYLAALFHDCGKMWDYKPTNEAMTEWESEKHKYLIHHISRSGIIWTQAVQEMGVFQEATDDILHAILAHHGQRAWGSPVSPSTRLAWLLHLCDGLSARMYDCYTFESNYKKS
jgi:3'-5' exoribonuclease